MKFDILITIFLKSFSNARASFHSGLFTLKDKDGPGGYNDIVGSFFFAAAFKIP
jgi:hypothetical protein